MAFQPFSMAVRNDKRAAAFYPRAFALTMFSGVALVLMIAANLDNVIMLFGGGEYLAATIPASILLLSNLLFVSFVFASNGANIMKRTVYHTYAYILAISVSIALNAFLVPRWGILGAASANICANIVLVGTAFLLSHRVYPVNFDLRRSSAGILVCSVVVFGMAIAGPSATGWQVAVKNAAAVVALIASGFVMIPGEEAMRLWRRIMAVLVT